MKWTILILILIVIVSKAGAQEFKPLIAVAGLKDPGSFKNAESYTKATILKPLTKNKKNENAFLKKIYLKIFGGYGIFTPGSYSVSSTTSLGWTDANLVLHDTTIKKQANHGIGWGPRVGVGFGFIQNDFLNFGIDIQYQPLTRVKNELNTLINNTAFFSKAYDELSYRVVTLTPYVIFKALAKPKFFIYNKLGVLLTLPFKMNSSGHSSSFSENHMLPQFAYVYGDLYQNPRVTFESSNANTYKNQDKMSLGIGLNVAFGINFRINERLRAFGEIFGNYSALTPANGFSESYSKSSFSIIVDTANFHKEYPSKYLSYTTNKISYTKKGSIGFKVDQFEDLGVDSEGYHESRTTGTNRTHEYTINMTVLGINAGLIYRF